MTLLGRKKTLRGKKEKGVRAPPVHAGGEVRVRKTKGGEKRKSKDKPDIKKL